MPCPVISPQMLLLPSLSDVLHFVSAPVFGLVCVFPVAIYSIWLYLLDFNHSSSHFNSAKTTFPSLNSGNVIDQSCNISSLWLFCSTAAWYRRQPILSGATNNRDRIYIYSFTADSAEKFELNLFFCSVGIFTS
jgi:hypothetical protein